MMQYYKILKFTLFLVLLSWTGSAFGAATEAMAELIEKNGDLCVKQTSKYERLANIPLHLLTAISQVESGFWVPSLKANVAWPWTVTSGSKNWYFASKDDAITQVLELWVDGVKNIDVGCMQINLYYHGDAFKDLEQALEPSYNVAYATKFLKNIYNDTKSWTRAAGFYHSKTPARYRSYKLKVIKTWNEVRRTAGNRSKFANAEPSSAVPMRRQLVEIDRNRTNELNARLQTARAASRGESPQSVRQGQLAAWRGDASGIGLLADKRRAQLKSQSLKRMHGDSRVNKGKVFAAKRRDQLQYWRRNIAKVSSGF